MTTKNRTTHDEKRANRPAGKGLTLATVQAEFVACGRCSYFLAGYRVIHGLPELETAIAASDGQWLLLRWNEATRRLVQQSYGCQIDRQWYHFESCCPVCYRRFYVALAPVPAAEQEHGEQADTVPEDQEPVQFRVQLIPG